MVPARPDPPITVQRLGIAVVGLCTQRVQGACTASEKPSALMPVRGAAGTINVCSACLKVLVSRGEWGVLGERDSDREEQSSLTEYALALKRAKNLEDRQTVARSWAGRRWKIDFPEGGAGVGVGPFWVAHKELHKLDLKIACPAGDPSLAGLVEVGPAESEIEMQHAASADMFRKSKPQR